MRMKCFKTRQLYANKNVSKRDNYMRIKCFKNETIICE